VEKILISACLLGAPVRYHGGSSKVDHARLRQWADEGRLVPVCPEVEGGLPTPRPPAEIRRSGGPAGQRVLVLTEQGRDVTGAYLAGARHALDLARQHGIRAAILKDRSPSCGSRAIYDGSFSGVRVPGEGVTAAALREAGLRVFSETEIDDAAEWLASVERA
jgi:uncharacterized protein YbbK (DUF523 family)